MYNTKLFLLRILFSALSITLLIVLSGCASGVTNQIPERSKQVYPERFTAGDGVKIISYPDTTFLNGVYPIDMDGNIFLPIVGKVNITEMNCPQFITYLQKNFQQYLRYPEIQVRPLIRVSLLGGFARPGLYYVEPERSVWDIIYMTGGATNEKGLRQLRWERDRKVIMPNMIPYIENSEPLYKIGFRSGDQLWTPTDQPRPMWELVRDILPIATVALSLYVSLQTLNRR